MSKLSEVKLRGDKKWDDNTIEKESDILIRYP